MLPRRRRAARLALAILATLAAAAHSPARSQGPPAALAWAGECTACHKLVRLDHRPAQGDRCPDCGAVWSFIDMAKPPATQVATNFPQLGGPPVMDNRTMVVGPGSSDEGDLARGLGVMYSGLGQYNYDLARAQSLNTSTAIMYNDYIYYSRKIYNAERRARILARNEKQKQHYDERYDRLRNNPTERDLMSGDSLNVILQDLTGAMAAPSVLRMDTLPVDGGTVRKIPFQFAQSGAVVSWARLMAREPSDWPLALLEPAFEKGRREYERATDRAVNLAVLGGLDLTAAKAVQAAVARMQTQADQDFKAGERREEWAASYNHLRKLDEGAKALRVGRITTALAEIETYAGTTVADLLEFMQRYDLRFAPAETPEERELYRGLYHELLEQHQRLAEAMAANPGAPDPRKPTPDAAGLPAAGAEAAKSFDSGDRAGGRPSVDPAAGLPVNLRDRVPADLRDRLKNDPRAAGAAGPGQAP